MKNVLAFLVSLALFSVSTAFAQSACLGAPALPPPTGNLVQVSTVSELQSAVSNVSESTTIVIAPGNYLLTQFLSVRKNNVTIRGEQNTCDGTTLIGKGMENGNFGNVPHFPSLFLCAKEVQVRSKGVPYGFS